MIPQNSLPPPPRRSKLSLHHVLSLAEPTLEDDESIWQGIRDISSTPIAIPPNPSTIIGDFADVYIGTHDVHGKVAMKRPRMSDIQLHVREILREVRTWQELEHDHVLAFIGIYRKDNQLYLVSPWMDNGTIVQYVLRNPGVDRFRLLQEAASALAYLHSQGVIHGNIKGANILISPQITAKICDFGNARLQNARLPSATAVSIRWRSPELFAGGSKDARSDVWAFGMTICEVLTGALPYCSYQYVSQVSAAIRRGELPDANPMFTAGNISNYPAWRAARHCWVKRDRRITMADIAGMLNVAQRRTLPETQVLDQPCHHNALDTPLSVVKEVEEWTSCDESRDLSGEDLGPCYCDWTEEKPAIECADAGCIRTWFHLDCIGLVNQPDDWHCFECETREVATTGETP